MYIWSQREAGAPARQRDLVAIFMKPLAGGAQYSPDTFTLKLGFS